MMSRSIFPNLWIAHSLCCLTTLLSSIVILWPQVYLPDAWEERGIAYAGVVTLAGIIISLVLVGVSLAAALLQLHYRRACIHMVRWAAPWAVYTGVFVLLAYIADVPLPTPQQTIAEQGPTTPAADDPKLPGYELTGPNALFLLLTEERLAATQTEKVEQTPHLNRLGKKNIDLLEQYLNSSPRWAASMNDETFYSKPGHVVMSPPTSGSNIAGLVHVAFCRLVEGDPMPNGYTSVKPGEPMPKRPEGSEQVPDLAVELGHNHYLLLAWRGTAHTETAHRALNAAIAAVDTMLQPLAERPSRETIRRMIHGKRVLLGEQTTMLSQPPSQYGAYQAEVYTNPGEPGELIVKVIEVESGKLRCAYACPALFSHNPAEVFRHDFPGAIRARRARCIYGPLPRAIPAKSPLFAIKQGVAHEFFDVYFEVWFRPATLIKPTRLISRKIFRVQACEETVAAINADAAEPAPQNTPDTQKTK